jgi:hypothetical protein
LDNLKKITLFQNPVLTYFKNNHLISNIPGPAQQHLIRPSLIRLVGRFDGRRIGKHLLDELDRRGFSDLAFALVENLPQFDDEEKFRLAVRSLSFEKAIDLLLKTYRNSPGTLRMRNIPNVNLIFSLSLHLN